MKVKANVNRRGKITQIKPLHLEVPPSLIAKVQAEIAFVTSRRDFTSNDAITYVFVFLIIQHFEKTPKI